VSIARPDDYGEIKKENVQAIIDSVEIIWVYSIVWSLGANLDIHGKIIFNKLLKETIEKINKQHRFSIPIVASF